MAMTLIAAEVNYTMKYTEVMEAMADQGILDPEIPAQVRISNKKWIELAYFIHLLLGGISQFSMQYTFYASYYRYLAWL